MEEFKLASSQLQQSALQPTPHFQDQNSQPLREL